MAYKKYIKRGGKLYGPYIYHSKRVDGKVVSEYHGPKKEINYKNFILIGAGILFLLAVVFLISTGKFSSGTGNAILDLNANYQEGQPLSGKLSMSLQQGELIPSSSQIIFDNKGKISQYALKDLISEETQQGNFYVSGSLLSGNGEGYGLMGKKDVFPEVSFTLNILSESTNSSEVVSDNVLSQTENTSSGDSNSSGILDVVSNFFLSLTPTGHAIVEFESQIQGTVSADENFVYDLQPGQRVELQPLSVFYGNNQLADNVVHLTTEGNQVIVTTDYSESSEGFGQDYLGTGQKNIDIDLSKTGFVPEEGNLKISFVDGSTEIMSLETVLQSSGSVSANKTVETPVVVENPVEIPKTNTEQNQTLAVLPPAEVSLPSELTVNETLTLAEEFGNAPVTIGEAKERNGVLVVKYELGNYWIENSYSVDLTREELNSLMSQDVIKWQKDLAKRLSEAKAPEEADVPGIVGTNFSLVG